MEKADTFRNYIVDQEATARNIRNFMKITGYTARDMAELLGNTTQTFFNWQEGKNIPGIDNLLKIASILKVPMEKIVVFTKREENIPLKPTNSGFVRNSVFFTYNNATQCMLRDCIAFNKKYGVFPDKLILCKSTFDNWTKSQNVEAESDSVFGSYELPENMNAELSEIDGAQFLKTEKFSVEFVFDDKIPENYYRLISEGNCSLE